MNARKIISFLMALALIIVCFTGCSGSGTSEPAAAGAASTGGSAPPPAADGKDTLVIASYSDITDLDPNNIDAQSSHVVKRQMYETLISIDSEGNLIPVLAESWEFADDTTMMIHLRENVKFHTGGTLKASDVLFSLNRMRESSYASTAVQYIDLDKSEAVDDLTVKLVMTQPLAAQMNYFNWGVTEISSEDGYNQIGGDFSKGSIGTGPYKFVSYVKDSEVKMTKFDDYWEEGKPHIDNLTFRFITEATTRSLELESGGVDVTLGLPYLDVERFSNNPDTYVLRQLGTQMFYFGHNFKNPVLAADVNVRKAMFMAVDWPGAVQASFGASGEVAQGFLAHGIEGYLAKDDIPFDPEGARKLLDESGFTPEELTFSLYTSNNETFVRLAEIVQASLAEVGVTMEIKALEEGAWEESLMNGDHDFTFCQFSALTMEASKSLTWFTSTTPWHKAFSWDNTDFDVLVSEGSATLDQAKRVELYQEAQQMIYDDAVAWPVLNICVLVGARSNVQGLVLDGTFESHMFKNVYFS